MDNKSFVCSISAYSLTDCELVCVDSCTIDLRSQIESVCSTIDGHVVVESIQPQEKTNTDSLLHNFSANFSVLLSIANSTTNSCSLFTLLTNGLKSNMYLYIVRHCDVHNTCDAPSLKIADKTKDHERLTEFLRPPQATLPRCDSRTKTMVSVGDSILAKTPLSSASTKHFFNEGETSNSPLIVDLPSVKLVPVVACGGASSAVRGYQGHRRLSSASARHSNFSIDPSSIINDPQRRTTVMVRNIPQHYTQTDFIQYIDTMGIYGDFYNFLYLPVDFKNKCNVGYAFINFVSTDMVLLFHTLLQDHSWSNYQYKMCKLSYARLQGLDELFRHFQNTSVITHDHCDFKPIFASCQ